MTTEGRFPVGTIEIRGNRNKDVLDGYLLNGWVHECKWVDAWMSGWKMDG